MNINNIYFRKTKIYHYNNEFFNPSKLYPEGINIELSSDKEIYNEIRALFYDMGLDKNNYGKKNWNPFGEFINYNNNVVIKPNLVKHINESVNGNTDSLITNFSIIRPIIDYALIALNGTGKLIIGDAPVQECIFEKVIKINDLKSNIIKYNKLGYKIELIDFRKNDNKDLECRIVSIGENSSFSDIDNFYKKYAITNYNLKYMHQHHHNGIHEYLIPQCVLDADVIINLPKPKTHRKAGITSCMKNFVGINGKKEYLPHHRSGSIKENGDEYPEKSIIRLLHSKIQNYTYTKNFIILFLNRGFGYILRKIKKERYFEGSWYGNDTIWRTILDINKIIIYSDKKGVLHDKQQRIIFNLADMIISGECEGPLLPTNKKVGLLVASFNQLNMDKVICSFMGFDFKKIKYIFNGYKLKKHKISNNDNFAIFCNGYKIKKLDRYNYHFTPTDGWKDYLIDK